MPVDIASAVVPEYTAAIPVPLDGEYANSAALIDMIAPLANRIEFLRQGIDSDPWRRTVYFEDFTRAALASEVLSADNVWSLLQNNSVLFVGQSSSPTSPAIGTAVFQNNSGSSLSAHLLPSAGALQPASFDKVETLAVRARIHNIASGMAFEFGAFSNTINGVAQATGDGVAWIFQASASPNWRLRTVNGGASSYVDSGIPVANNADYSLRIDQPTPGTWVGRIQGVASLFTAATNQPGGSVAAGHQLKWSTPNAGADRWISLDYLYARYGSAGRVF